MFITEEFDTASAESNLCKLRLQLKDQIFSLGNGNRSASTGSLDILPREETEAMLTRKLRNSDIFVGKQHLLICVDKHLYKFRSSRCFDAEITATIVLRYDTKENCIYLKLPCLPASETGEEDESEAAQIPHSSSHIIPKDKKLPLPVAINWSKFKRLTSFCRLQMDCHSNLYKLDNDFAYGFASRFRGKIRSYNCNLDALTSVMDPGSISPLQRSLDRHLDEDNSFSREQYKLNFVEIQIPEGHNNPLRYTFNYRDCTLSHDEECLLHNLTRNPNLMGITDDDDQVEIDNSLISILLAICYEIRTTFNEVNCESAWTRSALTAAICYFEPFYSLRDVVISFFRRSLIYPLYRNYHLSRQCIEDCVLALQRHPNWILKQLLATHQIFLEGEREVFNYYIIDDYVRYVSNPFVCPPSHLQMLAYNLKNILMDLTKGEIGLGLVKLESELLREIISDIRISTTVSSEDDSEDHDGTTIDESSAQSDHVSEIDEDAGTESFDSEIFISSDSSDSTSDEESVTDGRVGEQ